MSELSRNPTTSRPADPPKAAPRSWPGAVLIGLIAVVAFGFRLSEEPHFVDESAYYSQSYYAELFATGRWNDPAWLEYPAYDLPPLPKYLIGSALKAGGYRMPGPGDAQRWYENTSYRMEPPGGLTAARLPVAFVGAIGCVAVYGIGVLVAGRGVGFVAALLLLLNPLYRLLSRRAMSDVPCEAFLEVGLFFTLWAWKGTLAGRSPAALWPGVVGSGSGVALSLLSKMSGILYFPIAATWAVLGVLCPVPFPRKWPFVVVVAFATVWAVLTFIALDPFLTTRPGQRLPAPVAAVRDLSLVERVRLMFDLRLKVAADQQSMFRHNAVRTPAEKVSVVAVQGFGRFGPFGPAHSDSTRRFDPAQDWGAVAWIPWVAGGAVWAWRRGRHQWASGEPPTCWALLAQFGTALAVVTAYLPMAWDRYFLPLQAPAALLAAGVAVAAGDWVVRAARQTRHAGPAE